VSDKALNDSNTMGMIPSGPEALSD
jgi:hypothetical protein